MLLGTIVNVITVIVGGALGLLLAKLLSRIPRLAILPDALMKAISVFVIFIGIQGAFESKNTIVVLLSLLFGTLIGTIIDIDGWLERLGKMVERRFMRSTNIDSEHEELKDKPKKSFSKGFVSTTLTCCVGSLSIMGAIESGLGQGHELLFTKAVLDFITAFVFSSSFGIGALFAVVPLFIYQGAITLGASFLEEFLQGSIPEISAVGSLIVTALGLNMVGATKIKVANMLPSIFLPILLCLFM